MLRTIILFSILYLLGGVESRLVNFEDEGALGEDMSNDVAWANGRLMNETLNALAPGLHFKMLEFIFVNAILGDVFVVPNKTFHIMGGIIVYNISSVTFQLGTWLFIL